MRKGRQLRPVAPGKRRGIFLLPANGAKIYLNPTERTLYHLFMAHPEGIAAENLLLYWQELQQIYSQESRYDDSNLRDNALESLCAESKTVFYSNISRIKKKFITALGTRAAAGYIIKRCPDGLYRTRAMLSLAL